MGRMDGKVAIVTGAGNGMGACEAELLAREGAKVAVTDIREDDGMAVVEGIRKSGGDAVFHGLDVTDEEAWKSVIDQVVAAYGKLNVLVNNAGISSFAFDDTMGSDEWDVFMAINAKGPFLGVKHSVPKMKEAGGGSIVNISSIAGITGSTLGHPAYNSSKGAVRLFTKAMAARLGRDNIRVNSVHPGRMPPMTSGRYEAQQDELNERLTMVPLGRMGRVEEVGYAVLFLASDEASYITGLELLVDGGFTAV